MKCLACLQMVVRPAVVAPVLPLSLPNPAMGLPPVSLPCLPSSGLAPLPMMHCSAMQQPPATNRGSLQMQMPQQAPLRPPGGGPAAFPDPSQIPPPRPIQALTLPPASAHLLPAAPAAAAAAGPAPLPADVMSGLAQPPLQGHPVAFQPQQIGQQQLLQQPVMGTQLPPAGSFREAAGRGNSSGVQVSAAPPLSAFAASAAFPAVPSRSTLAGRMQVPCCNLLLPVTCMHWLVGLCAFSCHAVPCRTTHCLVIS